jgi:hypothetical protein
MYDFKKKKTCEIHRSSLLFDINFTVFYFRSIKCSIFVYIREQFILNQVTFEIGP